MPNIDLTYAGNTHPLPDRLIWADEYDWSPVEQTKTYTTTGALIIDTGIRQAGRPITLQGTESAAWITRALCDALRAWAALPGIEMSLTLRGQVHTVIFDQEKGAIEAKSLHLLLDSEHTADVLYLPTLRFIEV